MKKLHWLLTAAFTAIAASSFIAVHVQAQTAPGIRQHPGTSVDRMGRPCNMSGTNPPNSNTPTC